MSINNDWREYNAQQDHIYYSQQRAIAKERFDPSPAEAYTKLTQKEKDELKDEN